MLILSNFKQNMTKIKSSPSQSFAQNNHCHRHRDHLVFTILFIVLIITSVKCQLQHNRVTWWPARASCSFEATFLLWSHCYHSQLQFLHFFFFLHFSFLCQFLFFTFIFLLYLLPQPIAILTFSLVPLPIVIAFLFFACFFLASQDALEVMRVTDWLDVSIDFTDVTLVSDDTYRRLYWCDPDDPDESYQVMKVI